LDQEKRKQILYLVGMPGSGKSTLGKSLADLLGFPLIDIDTEIEKKEGLPITEIFSEKGEQYFREIEKEVLYSIDQSPAIVATGGGAPCFFDNMQFINANGTSIWLKVAPKALAERVLVKEGSRPLLKDLKGKGLIEELTKKLESRKGFYQQAHIHYDPISQSISDLETQITHIMNL